MDYLLFKTKANLLRRDLSSVIETQRSLEIQSSNRKRGLKRALNAELEILESLDFKMFWNDILIPNLKSRHQVTPTHSLEEIIKLHAYFPKNIRQFNVFNKQTLVAGVTIFESKHVAHVQYISGNDEKQKLGSLDMIFDHLINNVYKTKKYFDFGISNESSGHFVNEGLISWKESFGARSIAIDTYSIDTKNHHKLRDTLIR